MNFDLFLDAPLAVQIHVIAALEALLLGPIAIFRKKRDRMHKIIGYLWVSNIVIASLSSFFITDIGLIGPFSPIHILSVAALWGTYRGVSHAIAGQVLAHQRAMRSIYFWALCVAGSLTLLPGRRANVLLFGEAEWIGLIVIAIILGSMAIFQYRGGEKRTFA